jgi:hypothetical protein
MNAATSSETLIWPNTFGASNGLGVCQVLVFVGGPEGGFSWGVEGSGGSGFCFSLAGGGLQGLRGGISRALEPLHAPSGGFSCDSGGLQTSGFCFSWALELLQGTGFSVSGAAAALPNAGFSASEAGGVLCQPSFSLSSGADGRRAAGEDQSTAGHAGSALG